MHKHQAWTRHHDKTSLCEAGCHKESMIIPRTKTSESWNTRYRDSVNRWEITKRSDKRSMHRVPFSARTVWHREMRRHDTTCPPTMTISVTWQRTIHQACLLVRSLDSTLPQVWENEEIRSQNWGRICDQPTLVRSQSMLRQTSTLFTETVLTTSVTSIDEVTNQPSLKWQTLLTSRNQVGRMLTCHCRLSESINEVASWSKVMRKQTTTLRRACRRRSTITSTFSWRTSRLRRRTFREGVASTPALKWIKYQPPSTRATRGQTSWGGQTPLRGNKSWKLSSP